MDEVRPPELEEKKVVATCPPYLTTWRLVAATAASDAATCRSTGQYIWLRVSAKASKLPPPAVAAARAPPPPAAACTASGAQAAGPSQGTPPLTYRSTPTPPPGDSDPPLRAM